MCSRYNTTAFFSFFWPCQTLHSVRFGHILFKLNQRHIFAIKLLVCAHIFVYPNVQVQQIVSDHMRKWVCGCKLFTHFHACGHENIFSMFVSVQPKTLAHLHAMMLWERCQLIYRSLQQRGHSRTTLTRFWLFLTTYPPALTFSMVWALTKSGHFWTTYLPRLVNVVCECPKIVLWHSIKCSKSSKICFKFTTTDTWNFEKRWWSWKLKSF